MTAPSGKPLPVGLRHAQLFELNAAGLPNATSTTPYEGLEIAGPKVYELNLPDSRDIAHDGGDGVLDTDVLPPKEALTGSLRVARNDHDIYALTTGTKARTLGEARMIGISTSKQGYEPEFGLLLYQQSKDMGARTWRSFILPRTRLIAKPSGMVESPAEHIFQIRPSKVTKALWGAAFTLADDGFTRAFHHELETQYQPWIVAWKGDNVATEFLFHADRPAVATTKISGVWIDGVIDATVTKAVDKITPTTKPGAGSIIVALIEIANPMEG
jgi:hypothetical protein